MHVYAIYKLTAVVSSRKSLHYHVNDRSRFKSSDILFLKRNGDRAVVNVKKHCTKMSKIILKVLFPSMK